MKTITVAELRQNPTAALKDVEDGESFIVTKHRRPIAKLVPPDAGAPAPIIPAQTFKPSSLAARPRRGLHGYEETEALLAEMAADW